MPLSALSLTGTKTSGFEAESSLLRLLNRLQKTGLVGRRTLFEVSAPLSASGW